ncbi:jg6492 [Pararge aegeria aegeria]|uniref:Jg6492 protein n=1 Tax=Pararge aegeria aegeria TaxID=348720 RepID=A0A8S4SRP4_9NEOP|nr:jg6492 [Pararge aegeria aegeria]
MGRACPEDAYSPLISRYPDYRYRGIRKIGGHSRPSRCGSERKKQNASYVLMVFLQRNGADSFGASQFDGRTNRIAPEYTRT